MRITSSSCTADCAALASIDSLCCKVDHTVFIQTRPITTRSHTTHSLTPLFLLLLTPDASTPAHRSTSASASLTSVTQSQAFQATSTQWAQRQAQRTASL